MKFARKNLSEFTFSLLLTVVMFVVLSIAFGIYVLSEKEIDRFNEERFLSLALASELRQSSNELTRVVRAYVVTGDESYKAQYQEILEIRNGQKPRPMDIYSVYGGLAPFAEHNLQEYRGQSVPLLELMRHAGFTEAEFAKLNGAKAKSDALTSMEYGAMNMVEASPPFSDESRLRASELLHSDAYQKARADIMETINEFIQMMDHRTLNNIEVHKNMATVMRVVFILFGFLLLLMLYRTYHALRSTLGGSVDDVHAHIARIGSGDFAGPNLAVPPPEDSVLAWLMETRKELASIEAFRKEAVARNERMTRFYRALGQCSQDILRCNSVDELLPQICRNVVVHGGLNMAWIGVVDDEKKQIRPVASYGEGTGYVDGLVVSINGNDAAGGGPGGTCVREDRPYWCQDFANDPVTAPWRERGAEFGWKASAALPLHQNGKVCGVLSIYASTSNIFDEAVRNLLERLAMDIDYALRRFDIDAQRRHALIALAESRSLLQTIIDTAPVRIFWKDNNLRYIGCNPAFAQDAGVADPQELIGKDDYQMPWRDRAELYRADDRRVLESGVPQLFYDEPKHGPDGSNGWLRTSKVPLRNHDNEIIGVLGIYEDITEQKKAEDRIQYLANFDVLTGLPRRTRLDYFVQYAIAFAKRGHGHLALMFLDLDHFKDINDALGHSVGDAVLVELSRRLRTVVREEDTIARLGGDEFILLLPDTDADGAAHVAQKLLDAIAQPYAIDQYRLMLTASIGIAIYPNDGADLETLSKSADAAMYLAKREGRRGYRFCTPAMQERSARNLALVSALNQALERDELKISFQPQHSLKDGRVVGAEALLRWRHPVFGDVSPAEFIPVAEDSGLILPIGEKVLRASIRQAKAWMAEGLDPLVMAVNLSVVQFRSADFPGMVARILDEEGLPPEMLELELTESVAMNNPQNAIAMMLNLHKRGVYLAIDDFGTGYSSLSYLKKFKIHKLKIDQSFVRDISSDPEDKAIVGAIIDMAKRLGVRTIAEGVETAEQLSYLREQGCDEVQGFYCSKPLLPDEFALYMRESKMPANSRLESAT